MRWMYASANLAANLRFGERPAHEVVRRFFLPLWNSYGFFRPTRSSTAGRSDQLAGVEGARTLLDRWILSRLDAVVGEVREELDEYDAMDATRAIEGFVDDLSNWYVVAQLPSLLEGRARRRQASGVRDPPRGAHDLTQLLAPFVPHVADAMWDNLVGLNATEAPDSVHLTDFPSRVPGRGDAGVDAAVDVARRVVVFGRARPHRPSDASAPRAARVKLVGSANAFSSDPAVDAELRREITNELNVRDIELIPDESEMVERTLYPLLPVIGPRHGPAVGRVMAGARSGGLAARRRRHGGGRRRDPPAGRVPAHVRARPGHEVAEDGELLVALDTTWTTTSPREGVARDAAHRLQAMRKQAGYEISDRVRVAIAGDLGGDVGPAGRPSRVAGRRAAGRLGRDLAERRRRSRRRDRDAGGRWHLAAPLGGPGLTPDRFG